MLRAHKKGHKLKKDLKKKKTIFNIPETAEGIMTTDTIDSVKCQKRKKKWGRGLGKVYCMY